jgi:hypothetical protein
MDDKVRVMLLPLAVLSAVLLSPPGARADGSPSLAPRLACKGVLSFGDAEALSVRMMVDLTRAELTTRDCYKYPPLAGFCNGTVLKFRDHHFVFEGFESPENSKLWATLRRPSKPLGGRVSDDGVAAMRVLFLGRCEPTDRRSRNLLVGRRH